MSVSFKDIDIVKFLLVKEIDIVKQLFCNWLFLVIGVDHHFQLLKV
jgi:hypothetical protein